MYYSITFGDKNTWDDWHMVPTSRPLVNPAQVKTEYIEVPGRDGALDYTDVLAGTKIQNREGSWEFLVMNGYQEWHELYNELLEFLDGTIRTITLESEPGASYTGRFYIDSWSSEKDNSKVVIQYIIDTYVEKEEDPDKNVLKVLTFLESHGGQYINTDMKIGPDHIIDVTFGLTDELIAEAEVTSKTMYLFNVATDATLNASAILFSSNYGRMTAYHSNSYTMNPSDSYTIISGDGVYNISDLINSFKTISLSKEFYYNDLLAQTFSDTTNTTQFEHSLFLLAYNNKGTGVDGCGYFRLKSAKVSVNIPIYDLVTENISSDFFSSTNYTLNECYVYKYGNIIYMARIVFSPYSTTLRTINLGTINSKYVPSNNITFMWNSTRINYVAYSKSPGHISTTGVLDLVFNNNMLGYSINIYNVAFTYLAANDTTEHSIIGYEKKEIADLIPVKRSDDVICMYDRLNDKLLYNGGSGEFIAGAETGEEIILSYDPT